MELNNFLKILIKLILKLLNENNFIDREKIYNKIVRYNIKSRLGFVEFKLFFNSNYVFYFNNFSYKIIRRANIDTKINNNKYCFNDINLFNTEFYYTNYNTNINNGIIINVVTEKTLNRHKEKIIIIPDTIKIIQDELSVIKNTETSFFNDIDDLLN